MVNLLPKSPKYIRAVEDDVWTDMRMMSVSKKLTMGEYVENPVAKDHESDRAGLKETELESFEQQKCDQGPLWRKRRLSYLPTD